MANINFAHQDVLYHVFDLDLLSSLKNTDLPNSILNLQKPQIILNIYKNSINQQNQINNSSIYLPISDYSNTIITSSSQNTFDELNNIMITQPSLNEKPKTRQRKRHRLKKYSENVYESIDNNSPTRLVSAKPATMYFRQTINKRTNTLKESANVNQDLKFDPGLHCNSPQSVVINHPLTITALSKLISTPEPEIIKMLFFKGISVTINQIVSIETATSVAQHYGYTVNNNKHTMNISPINNLISLGTNIVGTQIRAPIVAILGHLNHGKTSLFHAIQKNGLLMHQIGGITQLIKAYEAYIHCECEKHKVIFLDTPGHKAFTNMRLLSIKITDFVILVIAANDDIDAPTIEIIQYIKEANIPLLIAINKIDKVNMDAEKIKHNFLNHNAVPKEWKNNVPIVSISATTGKNIDILSSCIITLTKQHTFKSSLDHKATGIIIDSFLDKNKGPVANVIVQSGILNVGDFIVAGNNFGKVRGIKNSQGVIEKLSYPSSVIEVWSFSQVPTVGCTFMIVKNEKIAKKLAKENQKRDNLLSLQKQVNFRITAKEHTNLHKTDSIKQVNIILKTGSQGTIEAILFSFSNIPQYKVRLNIMSVATGIITENDIKLATISKSIVIGFNTIVTPGARLIAKQHKVDINEYEIIDDLLYSIKEYMMSLLEVENTEKLTGTATVRSIFTLAIGVIAGCVVESGKVAHDSVAEISRNKVMIYKNKLKSLKHMKTNILEVKQGEKFGVSVIGFDSWQISDQIKFYNVY